MQIKKKRVRTHSELTDEKKTELRQAAEEEQALRADRRVKDRDFRMKNRAIAKEILAHIQSRMPSASAEPKEGNSGT